MAVMVPWLIGGGIAMTALGQYQAGAAASSEAKSQAAVSEYNAQVQEQEARAVEQQTAYRQRRQAEEAARYSSTLKANIGASGAVPSEGTPLLVLAKQAAEDELQNLMIGYEGQIGAGRARSQGAVDTMQAKIYKKRASSAFGAGVMGAGTTLLTGFGRWGSENYSAAAAHGFVAVHWLEGVTMPVFPMKYGEAMPPAVGPNVRASLNVDTGAEVTGKSLQAAGGALLGIGEKIQDAEDVMAISTLERKGAEIRNAAVLAMQETQDPEAQTKIGQKAKRDMAALGEGQRKRVADHYAMKLNQVLPAWDIHVADTSHRTRINRLQDEMKINDQADLEVGPAAGENYVKRQYLAEKTGLQTPEVTQWKIKNFGPHSQLAIADKQLASGQIDEAKAALNGMDPKTLSVPQAEERMKALRVVEREEQERGVKASEEISDAQVKLWFQDLSPAEFAKQSKAIERTILTNKSLNGTQREDQLRQNLAWSEHATVKANKVKAIDRETSINAIYGRIITNKIDGLEAAVKSSSLDEADKAHMLSVVREAARGKLDMAQIEEERAIGGAIFALAKIEVPPPSLGNQLRERIAASPFEGLRKMQLTATVDKIMAGGRDESAISALHTQLTRCAETGQGWAALKQDLAEGMSRGVFGLDKSGKAEARAMMDRAQRGGFDALHRSATNLVRSDLEKGLDAASGEVRLEKPERMNLFDRQVDTWILANPTADQQEAIKFAKIKAALLLDAPPAKKAGWFRGEAKESGIEPIKREVIEQERSVLPRVTGDDDFNALPPGTDFMDPKGIKRRKP